MTEPTAEDRELVKTLSAYWYTEASTQTQKAIHQVMSQDVVNYRTALLARHLAALKKAQNALIDIRDVACGEPQCKTAARTCLAVLKELGV